MAVLVYVLDVSISMEKPFSNFSPSKLEGAASSILSASRIAIETGYRVGLVVYAEWAVPLVAPTTSMKPLIEAVRRLGKTFLGSAPGDAVAEALRLLRSMPDLRKRVVVVTDGDYNMGVPLEYSLLYAKSLGVDVHIVVIGDTERTDLAAVKARDKGLAEWHEARSVEDLERILSLLSR